MTEAELQHAVIDLAHTFGWKVAHFRPARTEQGWRTPVAADGAGFPDLVLAHADRHAVLFRELKSDTGRLTDAQHAWLLRLDQPVLSDAGVWRPRDWPQIVAELSAGRAAA